MQTFAANYSPEYSWVGFGLCVRIYGGHSCECSASLANNCTHAHKIWLLKCNCACVDEVWAKNASQLGIEGELPVYGHPME